LFFFHHLSWEQALREISVHHLAPTGPGNRATHEVPAGSLTISKLRKRERRHRSKSTCSRGRSGKCGEKEEWGRGGRNNVSEPRNKKIETKTCFESGTQEHNTTQYNTIQHNTTQHTTRKAVLRGGSNFSANCANFSVNCASHCRAQVRIS
jgi:hypothetical protein